MGGRVMGDAYPLGREAGYFDIRDCWMDYRGTLKFAATAECGFEVMFITASHHPNLYDDGMGDMTKCTVQVDDKAWIANRAILFNCVVGHHATVGAGAVVKGIVIPPWTLADGNPAMIVATWLEGKWRRLAIPLQPRTNLLLG
jgi:acetyltransferase-like isoleucine patch superfamily enzyme